MTKDLDYEFLAEALQKRRELKQLSEIFGIDNRSMRNAISNKAKELPIIANSKKSGYKIAQNIDDLEEAILTRNELRSRIKELEKRLAPLEDFIARMALDDIRNNPSILVREEVI